MLGLLARIGFLLLIFVLGYFDFLGAGALHLARPAEFVWTLVFYAVVGGAALVLVQRILVRRRVRDTHAPRPWKRPGILGGVDRKDPVHNMIYGGWMFAVFGAGTMAGVAGRDAAGAIMVMSFFMYVGVLGIIHGWLCVRQYREYYENGPKS